VRVSRLLTPFVGSPRHRPLALRVVVYFHSRWPACSTTLHAHDHHETDMRKCAPWQAHDKAADAPGPCRPGMACECWHLAKICR